MPYYPPSESTGSPGSFAITEVEIDFGTTPVTSKQFTITAAGVTTSSKVMASQSGNAATGKTADENEADMFTCNCTAQNGSFLLNCRSVDGPLSGTFKVQYVVG